MQSLENSLLSGLVSNVANWQLHAVLDVAAFVSVTWRNVLAGLRKCKLQFFYTITYF